MGAYAATYHADKDCPALKQCQGKVKIYSLESAKKMGRKPLPFFVLIPLGSKNFLMRFLFKGETIWSAL